MHNSLFTETQIIGMIKDHEAGLTVANFAASTDTQPCQFLQDEG